MRRRGRGRGGGTDSTRERFSEQTAVAPGADAREGDRPMIPPSSTSPFLTRVVWWRRLRVRVLIAMVAVATFVSGALFATTYLLRKQSLLEQFQLFVTTIAGTGAVALSGDDLNQIEVNSDYVTPEFQTARQVVDTIRVRNGLSRDELYVLRPLSEDAEFVAEFVVMTHDVPFIGNRYEIREENREAYQAALSGLTPTYTDIYEDEHGTWISGYAPIFDETRRVVALLEADAEIGRYMAALRREVALEAGVTLVALVIAMVPIWFFARRLTVGINLLASAMRRFEDGREDVQLSLGSKDEIAGMAETFNRMAFSVGERLKLLPFVSKFTASAVEKSAYVDDWLEGQEREAAILMTDVRGFTRSSGAFAAKELVRHLNDLLAAQTDVVIRHGGDVDKFMGDAVLAVFMGHPDNLERAVTCGREILSRVQVKVRDWPEGWSLGAAVHHGTVVVGAVGSSARRDFTVIGHTVNQTAHLCAAARPWELLIPMASYQALSAGTQGLFEHEVAVALKHQAEATKVRSHRREALTGTPW